MLIYHRTLPSKQNSQCLAAMTIYDRTLSSKQNSQCLAAMKISNIQYKYFFYICRIFSNKERHTKTGEKATETNERSNTAFK